MEKELLTIEQAADYLSITPSALYHWTTEKPQPRIPVVRHGRFVRIRKRDIDRYIIRHLKGKEGDRQCD